VGFREVSVVEVREVLRGPAWETLLGREEQITAWAAGAASVVDREDRGVAGPAGARGALPHVAPVRGGPVRVSCHIDDDAGH